MNEDRELHIVLVEDDAEQRDLIGLLLEDLRARVTCLPDTEGLRTVLAKQKVDLIVSDWFLPGESGKELYYSLQETPGFKNIPFVLITAAEFPDADADDPYLENGELRVCSKLHLGTQLVRHVKELIGISHT